MQDKTADPAGPQQHRQQFLFFTCFYPIPSPVMRG